MNCCNDVEERSRAHNICQKYLTGAWKDVKQSEMSISKISGGMSNLLYHCALPDNTKTYLDEPRQVLLRIYGPTHTNVELQLEVFNKLASEKLGPRLYCAFEGGRLEEYLDSSPLTWDEMTTDELAAIVAKNIAAIHRLQMTNLKKDQNWLVDKFNHYINFIKASKHSSFKDTMLESTKVIAHSILATEFDEEVEYVTSLLLNSKEPLVFSHNDLHQNNILLLQDYDKNLNDRIVLIDFEYCSYNFRLFDIANHLSEWCFDYTGNEYPYFNASVERLPSREKKTRLLINYMKAVGETSIEDDKCMIEYLLKELQVLMMASNMLWALWAIVSACTSKIDFGYWEMSKMKWNLYLECKEQYQRDYSKAIAGDLSGPTSKM